MPPEVIDQVNHILLDQDQPYLLTFYYRKAGPIRDIPNKISVVYVVSKITGVDDVIP